MGIPWSVGLKDFLDCCRGLFIFPCMKDKLVALADKYKSVIEIVISVIRLLLDI